MALAHMSFVTAIKVSTESKYSLYALVLGLTQFSGFAKWKGMAFLIMTISCSFFVKLRFIVLDLSFAQLKKKNSLFLERTYLHGLFRMLDTIPKILVVWHALERRCVMIDEMNRLICFVNASLAFDVWEHNRDIHVKLSNILIPQVTGVPGWFRDLWPTTNILVT